MNSAFNVWPLRILFVPALLGVAGCPEPKESTDLTERLDVLEGDLTTLRGEVSELQAANDAKDAQIAALEAEVTALETTDTTLDGRVTALEANSDTGDLSALEGRVATLEGQGLDARLGAIEADYVTHPEVSAVDGRLAVIEADYATNTALLLVDGRVAAIEGDYVTHAELSALDGRVATIEGDFATATSVSALGDRVATIESDYATTAWVTGQAYLPRSQFDAFVADVDSLSGDVVHLLAADETWRVAADGSGDFTRIEDALAAADAYHILSDVTLTIAVASGTYSPDGAIHIHHPDGGRIRIEGDAGVPVSVSFAGSDGFVIDEGSALGYLGGLTLSGDGSADYAAVLVENSSMVTAGPIVIDNFGYGYRAMYGGIIVATDEVSMTNINGTGVDAFFVSGVDVSQGLGVVGPASVGVEAHRASTVDAEGAVVDGAHVGFSSQGTSFVVANFSAANITYYGYGASSGSAMEAVQATSVGGNSGFEAAAASYLDANDSTVSDAAHHAYYAQEYGYLEALRTNDTSASHAYGAYTVFYNGGILASGAVGNVSKYGDANDVEDFIVGL